MTWRRRPGSGCVMASSCEAITCMRVSPYVSLVVSKLARHPSAIDHQDLAGHVVTGRRCQEHGRAGQIFGLAPAGCWNARQYLAVADLVRLERRCVGRPKIAGRDGIDLH